MGRELRWYGLLALSYFLVLEGLIAAAIVWWPSFAENLAPLKRMAAPVPILSEVLASIERTGVAGYVIGQHFFKACNALGSLVAVLLAAGAVAMEAQRGTLELWLSRPVPRARLLGERFFLGLFAVCLPVFVSSATIPWLLATIGETMPLGELMLCSWHQSLFLGAIYGLTFFASSVGSRPVLIAFVGLLLCLSQFGLYMVKQITHTSIYRLVDIETFLALVRDPGGALGSQAALAATTLAAFGASLAAFARRVP